MQDLRIPEITEDIRKKTEELVKKRLRYFEKRFKVSTGSEKRSFKKAFNLSLRKALREIDDAWTGGPKKYVHLFCGEKYQGKEEIKRHIRKHKCKPSKATQRSIAAKDRVLQWQRKRSKTCRKTGKRSTASQGSLMGS